MSYRIQIADTQQVFFVERGETLLQAAQRASIALPHDCQLGGCGTCRIRLFDGQVRYDEEPFGLAPDEAAAGYALACQAQPLADLVIGTAREGEACAEPARHRAVVQAVRPLSADVMHVELEVPDAGTLDYRPGQYLKLVSTDGLARSFSMASVPRDGRVDLHVRRIPGGAFTDGILPRMRAGDAIDVELPLGNFFYRSRDYRPLLMVATGTGLAPIKAILESLMGDPDCPPVSLYWGMRQPHDLYLHDAIPAWGERLYDFQYVPVLSRAGTDWQGRRGYVHDAALADLGDLSEHAIYLCGSPDMIRDARAAFLAHGASPDHLYADSFTFQHLC
ncbi:MULTISPECIES: 2Fe-2S iron-sulfur cluster-binding protein [Cupriavidus]|uniref:2Fe-2S iron-sulfur cluster binding domain-containing protein n=1 Tax=Cupriavidus oxalaticus TaxID=96344 RepID=A0A4P7L525_9BURK|nr:MULTISPECIES: 2Fe-2S iron-sulfur cluster-binding protein [Cupriavidus]MBF6986317.1 2Fe-2S iron-sulfur cluster binding domain-containing protein [Cupriavidus sp. IK-TO18]QBY50185.1 2Fe-2S iron-sulfur cluster binding domain-containing protein [Cupriavidus oxalaticus]TDF65335.1 2Fe-2S iron-sulfur cluster binding domain-containing protein [Cupriavidus sp. L7L]